MARNAALAVEATSLLCQRLDTEPGSEGSMAAAIGVIRVPVGGHASPDRVTELRDRLLSARRRTLACDKRWNMDAHLSACLQ
jgi:isopenicillin-N epimerase